MLDVLEVSLKHIKDVDKLLELRDNVKTKLIEVKENDTDNEIIKLLKNRYFNISTKINYINNRQQILEKYKDKNREYVKNNYEIIKQKNKEYQKNRRLKFKELEAYYNNTNH